MTGDEAVDPTVLPTPAVGGDDVPFDVVDALGVEPSPDFGRAVTSSLAWSTWALFTGMGILLVGVGLLSTAVGIRSELNGYENWVIGLIGAAYYAGFLAGSKLTLAALATVGHIRSYAALASLLAAAAIVMGLADHPAVWIGMRFATGMCIAGQYVIAESWLNQLGTNATRGRILAVYMVVTGGAYGLGQVLVGRVHPESLTAFAVAALLISVAVSPVALSEDAVPPPMGSTTRLTLRKLAEQVPTGVGSCFLVGVTHGALIAMGAVYATRVGMSPAEAGRFVAATAVGGVVLQWPISVASDELDRRFVGGLIAFGTAITVTFLLVNGPFGWPGLFAMALIGGLSFPLYSIAGAYTNDWVEPRHVSSAASQLVVLYGAGAFAGPLLVSLLMGAIGSNGYLWSILTMHLGIVVFFVYRVYSWRAPLVKQPWRETSFSTRAAFYVPANMASVSRRIGHRRRQ